MHRPRRAGDAEQRRDQRQRRLRLKRRAAEQRQRLQRGVHHQHAAEPPAPQDRRGERLDADIADEQRDRHQPRPRRVEPHAELEHQRQRERHGADDDPRRRAAGQAEAEALATERPEVGDGMRRAPHVLHEPRRRRDREQRRARAARQPVSSSASNAAACATPARTKPLRSNGRASPRSSVGVHSHASTAPAIAERQIDIEDRPPAPGFSEKPAERRPDQRRRQRRPSQQRRRAQNARFRRRAQHDEPPDRDHERPADPLQRAREHENPRRRRQPAQRRAQREQRRWLPSASPARQTARPPILPVK